MLIDIDLIFVGLYINVHRFVYVCACAIALNLPSGRQYTVSCINVFNLKLYSLDWSALTWKGLPRLLKLSSAIMPKKDKADV
jgi:hypothetical protein